MSALDEDLQDLEVVADHLTKQYGYVIDLLVGHSRGSLVAMRWMCTSEDAKNVRGFINASGRYRMEVSSFLVSSCAIIDTMIQRMYGRSFLDVRRSKKLMRIP